MAYIEFDRHQRKTTADTEKSELTPEGIAKIAPTSNDLGYL